MKPANVELLSGRDMGISQSYYKPTEHQILQDYLNAIPYLTINEENRLRTKVRELTIKQDEIYLMKLKHEKEMREMREQIYLLMESRKEMLEMQKHPQKLLII